VALPPRRSGGIRPAAAFETALIAVGLLVLLVVLPHGIVGDDNTRFNDIEGLFHHGHLSDSRHSLVGPLLSAPFLLLGELVGTPAGWAARFNVILVALALVASFRLTRNRIDAGLFRKFALVLLFASLLTNRLREYDTEVVTATLAAFGMLAVATGRRAGLGWAAIVLGVVNQPPALGGLALVAGARALQQRRLRVVLAPVAAALLIIAEAWIRRGGPLTTGYEDNYGITTIMPYSGRAGFSYPFVLGLVSILVSFGRGLAFFAPGLLLWLGARTRRLVPGRAAVTLWLLFLAGLVLVYAKWWAWYGGISWGPRYFVFAAIPASLFLASRLHGRGDRTLGLTLTLAVLALSAWVGLAGALQDSSQATFCSQDNFQHEALCWYAPDFSSLWWPILHHPGLTWRTGTLAAYCFLVFAYLAAPLVAAILRSLAPLRSQLAHGWRF
jgi:hypothetical protein